MPAAPGADFAACALGDLDNNGYTDIIFQSQATGSTKYAAMDSHGFNHWGSIADPGNHLHVV